MARTRLIAALILTYVAFAMLLNSVGTVILQSISSFHVTKTEASTLEAFKDITIAVVSFLTASYLSRLGLRNALIGALGRVPGWRGWTRCFPAGEIARAEAALQSVGLLALAGTRADRLSGGERQKAAIARLLVQAPSLILADEPTAALDPSAAAEVCRLLVLAAAGKTLITVVHNPSLLPLLAERVIGLKQGRIAFDLPVSEVDDATLMRLYRPGDSPQQAFWETPSALEVFTGIGSQP